MSALSEKKDDNIPHKPTEAAVTRLHASNDGKIIDASHLPERYSIKTLGEERLLNCLEAPNLNVHIESGLVISGAVAKKSPGGTIFLDGVAQCEPFLDHEHKIYNMDHHEGCVRAFTLSCCEQTLVMYMKGLDLRGEEWHIFANEPDLDTVLAIWILLNHGRIGNLNSTQRRILFALVRYEGVIDSFGLELKELSALAPDLMRKIQRVVDRLRKDEINLKKQGAWQKTDYLDYTVSILHKIDQIFYKSSDFKDYQGVEELARIDLIENRIAAVVEADMGIYEIEPHLGKIYGNRLGIVFLKKGPNVYTVRQMDLFMPLSLDEVYDRLNFEDPAVKCRTAANKWGGANDIGGSPRDTGTGLAPADLARTCRDAVCKWSFGQQAFRFLTTFFLSGFIVLCAYIAKIYWKPENWIEGLNPGLFWSSSSFCFAMIILMATSLSLLLISHRHPWQYGWITSCGKQWWLLLPALLAAALAGGVWIPKELLMSRSWPIIFVVGAGALPLAFELLFRSLVHGMFAQHSCIQRCDSPWFISWPALASTLLYTGFIMAMVIKDQTSIHNISILHLAMTIIGAAVFGLTTAMVRERSQSLLPVILFHGLAAVLVIIFKILI
ncbi:MAG: CPBP family intramembrane metalloprotease [Desulfobacteraceae bacterium]|nr:CPBP family intramembrane metalloprotease [Desulfobacteraceae bacterium]